MISASIRWHTRFSTPVRPCKIRSSPSLPIMACTAATCPCGRLRTISKPGSALRLAATLPPSSSATMPSISAGGSFDKLASVRFLNPPPPPKLLRQKNPGGGLPVGKGGGENGPQENWFPAGGKNHH